MTLKKPYELKFPEISIGDMVKLQIRLIDFLKIDKLFCVIGGSMGGMQVLEWGANYSKRAKLLIPIATSFRHTAQNIALHDVTYCSIHRKIPDKTLCLAGFSSLRF